MIVPVPPLWPLILGFCWKLPPILLFGTGALLPSCQQVVLLPTEPFACLQLEMLISRFLQECFLSLFLPQMSQAFFWVSR